MAETTRERAKRLGKLKDELVTGLQAADIKGVTPKSIYEAIKRGALPSVKVGGQHLINRKDLDKYKIYGHNPPKKRHICKWMEEYKAQEEHEKEAEAAGGILSE